ncbi:MAG: glycosyl hydrolase [Proteobacteria bacterium]|nr:glycosyl hydrolase [Pseudomonadota bacterium]
MMTAAEKAAFLSGNGMWRSARIERLGIDPIVMTDGTYGVRYTVSQIEGEASLGERLDAFLGTVNQRASTIDEAVGDVKPATCFPNGSALGNSWDTALMEELGILLGRECRSLGVDLLLGPGINIRRTPLAGRAYEYYSEDPFLMGKLAARVIHGLQSQGVGASLKHFACYNCEDERMTMDSVVDERALREIYLRGFEIAIRESRPWTVMSSYNRLNGVDVSQSHWLLTDVLRQEWGFDGLVISDWNAIKDRPTSLLAGCDLDMPESPRRRVQLEQAIETGAIPAEVADRACARLFDLLDRIEGGRKHPVGRFSQLEHHQRARAMAAASIVLAKNEADLLPLREVKSVLVVGRDALVPVIQGSGCATTLPTLIDAPLEELRKSLGEAVTVSHRLDQGGDTFHCVATADVVIAFVSTEGHGDGEGRDRRTLALGPGQDAMIEALAAVSDKLVVVLSCPDAVEMPWIDRIAALLICFYPGQALGGAVADLLCGTVAPSAKLSVTFPQKLEDVPGYLSYPGELDRHVYSEGIHVGYRGYLKRKLEPLFPFGHGLSYTRFGYADPELSGDSVSIDGHIDLSFTLTNIGNIAASEISQVYLEASDGHIRRAVRELKGFAKTFLQPRESRRVTIRLEGRDLAVWHPERSQWVLEEARARLLIGASCEDIRANVDLHLLPSVLPWRDVGPHTRPEFILQNPYAMGLIKAFLARRLGITPMDAELVLQKCKGSVSGLFASLERYLQVSILDAEVNSLFMQINSAMRHAEAGSSLALPRGSNQS